MTTDTQARGAIIVSTVVVLGFVGLCVLMVFRPITDNPTIEIMFGALSSGFTGVTLYWIGSSSGSRSKDKQIEALASNQATPTTDVK